MGKDLITIQDAIDAGLCMKGVMAFVERTLLIAAPFDVLMGLATKEERRELMKILRGDGDGYGIGYGGVDDGYGGSYGYGFGDGYGGGYGSGFGRIPLDISVFCGMPVRYIDGIPTIIRRVHGNFASGYILLDDMTTKKTFIAKGGGLFAHGDTMRGAAEALIRKIEAGKSAEERVADFIRKYPAPDSRATHSELFARHGTLTGSCDQGRRAFCEIHGIDPESGKEMSVKDFIELTRNAYGGDTIRLLEKAYGDHD